jgi:hypothetical protein
MEGLVPLRFDPTTPFRQRHQALPPERFRLDPFSLAATGGDDIENEKGRRK